MTQGRATAIFWMICLIIGSSMSVGTADGSGAGGPITIRPTPTLVPLDVAQPGIPDTGTVIANVTSFLTYWNERNGWGLSRQEIAAFSADVEESIYPAYSSAGEDKIPFTSLARFDGEVGRLIGLDEEQLSAFVVEHQMLVEQDIYDRYYPDRQKRRVGSSATPPSRPVASAPEICPAPPLSFGGPGNTITVSITTPEDDDVIFYDVVPAYLRVRGTVDAEQGIRTITITNGENDEKYGDVLCGSNLGTHYNLSCEVFMTDHVTVVVTDTAGNTATVRRNFTKNMKPPGPGDIRVTGFITDPAGNPVHCASIIFERLGGDTFFNATTTSKADGSYSMKKASGKYQKITVQKDNYQRVTREAAFWHYNNEFNVTLVPEKGPKAAAGFGGISAILAGFAGVLLVGARNSR